MGTPTDYGYMEVTTTCPIGGCGGTDTIRVYGENGETVTTTVLCSTCDQYYAAEVVITVSGAPTEYELT